MGEDEGGCMVIDVDLAVLLIILAFLFGLYIGVRKIEK